MNRHLWKGLLCFLFCCPTIVVIVGWSHFSQLMLCLLLLLASCCLFAAIAIVLASFQTPSSLSYVSHTLPVSSLSAIQEDVLPRIPHTLREVLVMLNPTQFEVFTAALLVGMGEGYHFHEHCGSSGDRGIDVKLLNLYHQPVAVQCKFYAPDHTVGSPELREFLGSLSLQSFVYGFFVTTSTLTPEARRVVDALPGRIRAIDGPRLERLLQSRSRDIAIALNDILSDRRN